MAPEFSVLYVTIYLYFWPKNDSPIAPSYETSVPISVVRTLRGATQASGKLSLVISNHRSTPQSLVYLETMPWLVQFQLHTLQARVDGRIRGEQISWPRSISLIKF